MSNEVLTLKYRSEGWTTWIHRHIPDWISTLQSERRKAMATELMQWLECNEYTPDECMTNDVSELYNQLRMYASVRCSSAHTPTAEPQATTHPEHIPTVKREDM